MKNGNKNLYWRGLEELSDTPEFRKSLENEFPEELPIQALDHKHNLSRRSFLKAAGFAISTGLLAACSRGKVEKVIPLLNRPENQVPGNATWFASFCQGCEAACGILVKNRDGRPIKIEGNPDHPLSKGGVCAIGQASILGVYDSMRVTSPLIKGRKSTWEQVDATVTKGLKSSGKKKILLTSTIHSPTLQHLIQEFSEKYEFEHVQYDPVSCEAIREAHSVTHGTKVIPHYDFAGAEVIVSFDADFLGTWLSPVEFTRGYQKNRDLTKPVKKMSKHYQFEGLLSITGSKADERYTCNYKELTGSLVYLAQRLAGKKGKSLPGWNVNKEEIKDFVQPLEKIANQLLEHEGKSLVVCGVNDRSLQILVNYINQLVNNYGRTIDLSRPSYQKQGQDRRIQKLLSEMERGEIGALILYDVNPVYSMPEGKKFGEFMKKIPLTVSITSHFNETTDFVQIVCPKSHYLESWSDAQPVKGIYQIGQPMIPTTTEARTLLSILNSWMDRKETDYDSIRNYWKKNIYPRLRSKKDFETFWKESLERGFVELPEKSRTRFVFRNESLKQISLRKNSVTGYELHIYQKAGMLDGRHAYNPFLQELPDPITKVCWDNYATLAKETAEKLGVEDSDIIEIQLKSMKLRLPVVIQPGQHPDVIGVAVGYGQKMTNRFKDIGPDWISKRPTIEPDGVVGKNIYPFIESEDNLYQYRIEEIKLRKTGEKYWLARTQTYHAIRVPEKLGGETRHLIHATSFKEYQKDPSAGNEKETKELELWPMDHQYTGHHWMMVIDLTKCTGCSACVISCQVENNVPVVGKDEVYRRRDMHWIRIDRYYSGEGKNVRVVHQPVMCHHCDHAPCEGVCPVLATVHSDEGINQQIYNRCVGTRYCANNCPYKVRRFNWFDYRKKSTKEDLLLNPDVTTRSRGVMEKCSFCIQRILKAKAVAKKEGRELKDGDIKLACEQSCPAGAIVFGDGNDPNSRVSKLINDPRHYRMLEEMNFRPSVGYLTLVRNSESQTDHE
jgi:molybdopterin-containing oxidoreductase family iron-sulfur binding subunit